jgi:hypothetical protein
VVDDYFAGRDEPGEFEKLTESLRGHVPGGDYTAFEFFQIWQLSNYHQLPFQGGWVDQPTWVTDAFKWFLRVSKWWQIKQTLTAANELPNIDQILG